MDAFSQLQLEGATSDPIREWLAPDGQEMFALAPIVHASREQLEREGVEGPTMAQILKRVGEYANGERTPNDRMVELMREVDAEQRANGFGH